jgi:hypothetical protein
LIYETIVEDHYIYEKVYEVIKEYVEVPVPGETIYITEYVYVEVPGETVYITKEVPVEVPGERIIVEIPVPGEKIEVPVPGETIYIEVPVPGETVYIEIPVEIPVPGETIYIGVPVPGETVYIEVEVKGDTVYIEVPGETKYIDIPGETVYIEVPVYIEVEVPGPPIYIEKPMPPEILMQYIEILSIEFIIFSGNQTNYNWPSTIIGGTSLTIQEQSTNNDIVQDIVDELRNNNDYFLILHGHSNPVNFTQSELEELSVISTERAVAVQNAVAMEYNGKPLASPSTPPPSQFIPPISAGHDLIGRISTKGYGGGRNVAGPSSSYAGLNRRVEAILFKITEEPVTKVKGGTEK